MTWHPQLADDEDVEGRRQRLRYLTRDRNTAAGQRQDDDITTAGEWMEPLGERTPGGVTIVELL